MYVATSSLPWIIKYRPRTVEEVVDQEEAKKLLIPWIKKWLSGTIPEKKAALLYGPPGVGKTSLVEAICNEFKLEKIEMNASDFRRKKDIERVALAAATKRPLPPWRGRLVLLDEVDGLSPRGDEGAVSAILELVSKAKNPIVMTANDPWGQHLRPIREVSLLVPFKRIPKTKAREFLLRICENEGVECEIKAIDYILEKNKGDLRASINDLQVLAEGYGKVTLDIAMSALAERDRVLTPWEMLQQLFYAKYAWQARKAVTSTDLDYDTLFLWVAENVPKQYGDDLYDLWRGLEALSRADVIYGRIKRRMNWSLLPYFFNALGPGVAFAQTKRHRKAKWSYPEKITLLAKTKEIRRIREELASYLARSLHCSKDCVKTEVIPLLMFLAQQRPQVFAKIAIGHRLTDEMIRYLSGSKYKEVKQLIDKYLTELPLIYREFQEAKKEEKRKNVEEKVKEEKVSKETVSKKKVSKSSKKEGGEGLFKWLGKK